MSLLRFASATVISAFLAAPTVAHEFWIDVNDYTVAPGDTLEAALRVGQAFEGSSYAYLPTNFRRFELATGGDEPAPVDGRIGDRPALSVEIEEPGLATILHVTRDYELTWETWEQFVSFIEHKDADWALERHAARGLPQENVREVYSRYAKALAAVGDGAGADRVHGLLTEIVALENPYGGAVEDGLDVQVLYDGAPRSSEQIEIFAKDAEGAVTVSTVQTDAEGRATIPVERGVTYLLDSVVVRAPDAALMPEFDPMWETLWASLTFAVPAETPDS